MEFFWDTDILALLCAYAQWVALGVLSELSYLQRAVPAAQFWNSRTHCPVTFQKRRKNVGHLRVWGWCEAWQPDAWRQPVCTLKAFMRMWCNLIKLKKFITSKVCGRTAHGQVRCSLIRKEKQGIVAKQNKTLNPRRASVLAFSRGSQGPVNRGGGGLSWPVALSTPLCLFPPCQPMT